MKLGVLREEKVPEDYRVVFTPIQCKWIMDNTDLEIEVRSSKIRCFSDQEYLDLGVKVVEDLSDCDILLGIKEVPKENLIPNKTYFYFSHTIKKQPYNMSLLKEMIDLKIKMIDYEVLRDINNKRLIGFGKYAGIVGCFNAFLTYGLKISKYQLTPAYQCKDKNELENELKKIKLKNERILLTGNGNVAHGALEILNKAGIKEVSIKDYLNNSFDVPVFCKVSTMDYVQRIDKLSSRKNDFYNNPDQYESSFMKFASCTDIFIAGHFYAEGSPYLFTREDVKSDSFNIKVVADISCDIDGPVATTIKESSIQDPIYGYNPIKESEDNFLKDDVIAVMAISNLPCELPKDSSHDFGQDFINKILPLLTLEGNDIIKKATICEGGSLMDSFSYLQDCWKYI